MYAITGSGGFIGKHLISYLKSKKIKFIKIGRIKDEVDFVINDLSKETDWVSALKGVKVLFHLAGRAHNFNEDYINSVFSYERTNVDGTKKLIKDACKAGVKRIIFLSTIKVNGEKTFAGLPFTINSKENPQNPYAISKLRAEKALIKAGIKKNIEITIIRIPLVYGPRVKANFSKLINLVRQKIPLPFGSIKNKRSLIYVENLVDFMYLCSKRKNAINTIFLLSDPCPLSTSDLIRTIAKYMNIKPLLIPFPKILLKIVAFALGKIDLMNKLTDSLEIDPSYSYKALKWEPPFSDDIALEKTVKWFLKNTNQR